MKNFLEINGVQKSFGQRKVFEDFSLAVAEGEFVALLGPSGTGKTTLLRCLCGLDDFDAGRVVLANRVICDQQKTMAVRTRKIGMVFQDAGLFPHMTVKENIAYGLVKSDKNRLDELLHLVALTHLSARMPEKLSAGEQQRVALARSLAADPDVILLDEPFCNLDANLRIALRGELKKILKKAGKTAIFVTHDREEAISLADRIGVMIDGHLLQVGPPEEVYLNPKDKRVALFLGYANYLAGKFEAGKFMVAGTALEIEVEDGMRADEGELFFRPENLILTQGRGGTVKKIEYFGHDILVDVKLENGNILHARMLGPVLELAVGDVVGLKINKPYFLK